MKTNTRQVNTGKWTGSHIVLFYLRTQSALYKLPHSPIYTRRFFNASHISAFYLTLRHIHFTHIHTASESNLGSVSCPKIFIMQTGTAGDQTPNLPNQLMSSTSWAKHGNETCWLRHIVVKRVSGYVGSYHIDFSRASLHGLALCSEHNYHGPPP